MACVPGMPCYEPIVKIVYPPGCCPVPYEIINSSRVNYDGPNLACTGIQSSDSLNTALQKIDEKICSDEFVAQIIQTIENNSLLKAYFCQLVSGCSVEPTTTTTTTVNACPTPTLNSAVTDGFGNVTLNYNLNGSTGCTSVIAEYSDYSDFSPVSYGETITNGCNLTSYVLTLSRTSLTYVRIYTICNGITLESNILSVIPGNTTTTTTTTTVTPTTTSTTTNCTSGLPASTFVLETYDGEVVTVDIQATPIGEICALLPTIHAASTFGSYQVYGTVSIGQTIILNNCTPVPTGTYGLLIGSISSMIVFYAVVDGVITDTVTCS